MAETLFFFSEGGRKVNMLLFFFGKTWKLMFETVRENLDQRNKSFVVLKFSQLIFWKTIVFRQPVQADLSFFFWKFWRQRCAEERGIHAQTLRCQRCIRPGPGWTCWHRDGKWWGTWCKTWERGMFSNWLPLEVTCENIFEVGSQDIDYPSWKWTNVSKKGTISKRKSWSSNQEFSRDMLVFTGSISCFL